MQSMDPTKKRKLDEIVNASSLLEPDPITKDEIVIAPSLLEDDPITKLNPQDGRKLIERFTVDQLRDIFQDAVARHFEVLSAVRSIVDQDPSQRKLFIRGLGRDTTTDALRLLFSVYGELEDAVVIVDKATGKSRGYGFVTFKHVDGALLALKKPGKKIDGRLTVSQLAAPHSIRLRVIYVANVPYEMPADKLLCHFAQYGEIEKGPLGFDKQTEKSRGFALFVYKTAEGAHAALVDPVKNIDGKQINCKLAIEGKIGKQGKDGKMASGGGAPWNAEMGIGGHGGGYGGPGGLGGYGGFSAAFPSQHLQGAVTSPVHRVPPGGMHLNRPPLY
ncbi:hypothetical protein PTKIN_Ptkin02bG0234700 [Pterospermum kingtungense]